ncbi:carbohydrate ABC transporter permease [Rathayibacter agropyri]|uniref:carbohydrate ABC transporter permease n=1 Tax=Rathayibacter agropyri TaxID=1634927 RepID=UPI0015647D5F|nr:carbohydrate ABC transporter permease [Rathayibacter agropyri]NRD08619.1 carbohydrate ABC transporter permease [Rathayibacter agropyri]
MSAIETLPVTQAGTTDADLAESKRAPRPPKGTAKRTVGDWVILAVAVVIGLAIISPVLLILLNSFKTPAEYSASGPLAFPTGLSFDGLSTFWNRVDFPEKLGNSILISGSVAILAVALSVLNAYAIGIGRVKGRSWIIILFLLANMLPQEALLYPLYYMFKAVGIYDTQLSVIIIFTVIQSAFGTYLLSSVYGTFPKEILEAAALDGASKWQVLTRVIVPISRPTLSVLMIFFFIWTWNEFLIPLVFLVSDATQTVPIAISSLQGDKIMDVTTTSASALLGLLPTLIFFLIFQRTLTRGITAGAVK